MCLPTILLYWFNDFGIWKWILESQFQLDFWVISPLYYFWLLESASTSGHVLCVFFPNAKSVTIQWRFMLRPCWPALHFATVAHRQSIIASINHVLTNGNAYQNSIWPLLSSRRLLVTISCCLGAATFADLTAPESTRFFAAVVILSTKGTSDRVLEISSSFPSRNFYWFQGLRNRAHSVRKKYGFFFAKSQFFEILVLGVLGNS